MSGTACMGLAVTGIRRGAHGGKPCPVGIIGRAGNSAIEKTDRRVCALCGEPQATAVHAGACDSPYSGKGDQWAKTVTLSWSAWAFAGGRKQRNKRSAAPKATAAG